MGVVTARLDGSVKSLKSTSAGWVFQRELFIESAKKVRSSPFGVIKVSTLSGEPLRLK